MRKIVFILIVASLYACTNAQPTTPGEVVAIDFDNVKTVDIRNSEIIELEATDKSLLAYIDGLVINATSSSSDREARCLHSTSRGDDSYSDSDSALRIALHKGKQIR